MALVSMRQLLDHAAENNYGVPAFNVNNLEQMRAIMESAEETDSPVIVQASAGARKYAGSNFLRHLILAAIEEFPHIPVVMHQDHGGSPAVCQRSIQLGFSSVMMDGSLLEDQKTPASYEHNIEVTRTTVMMAHACGVTVEGELGCLGSLETGEAGEEDGVGADGVLSMDQLLTDPEQAIDFIEQTNCDALAIAIGTSHGAYKFSRPPTGDILAIDRIKAIHDRLPDTHLVMHGSSSVPQDWLKIINENGGEISETYGVVSILIVLMYIPLLFLLPGALNRKTFYFQGDELGTLGRIPGAPHVYDSVLFFAMLIGALGLLWASSRADRAVLMDQSGASPGGWRGSRKQWSVQKIGVGLKKHHIRVMKI